MQEKTIIRDGKQVTEVRSDAGKLLYIKTLEGYEIKCPRSKQICLIPYQEILQDCLSCLQDSAAVQAIEKVLQTKQKINK